MAHDPDADKPAQRSPKYLPGDAGQQAMVLWERIYASAGEAGINRADKEFDVFVWSVKGKQLWKFLVRTPDVVIEKERKIAIVRDHLQTLGCSELFVDLMAEMFNYDNLELLEQVAADFHTINREHRREVDVTLITPTELDSAALEFYKATISLNYLKEGDNLIFNHHVDTSFTKGYRVVVKDKVFDFTRDAARKAHLTQLEMAEVSRVSRLESRLKAAPTPVVTDAVKKDVDLKSFGLDLNVVQQWEEQAEKRRKEFEAARVQMVEKLAKSKLNVVFE